MAGEVLSLLNFGNNIQQNGKYFLGNRVAVKFRKPFRMIIPPSSQVIDPRKEQNSLGGGGISSCHIFFEKISAPENLFLAWNEFKRGKRARPEVRNFESRLEDNIFLLEEQLRLGTWRHSWYEQFSVCDPKPRQIHKATVADRLLHHALVRVIEPIFERSFIYDSWSCRQGKGTHHAVERCHRLLTALGHNNRHAVWILKGDIKKYFASIDHTILLDLIKRKITDDRAVALIAGIIESFAPGVPLGNLTSQLFANIYLNSFDHFVKERLGALVYLHYSDDFILAHHSRAWLQAAIPKIQQYLSDKLKLTLHPRKVIIRPFHHGIDWLGYVLYPGYNLVRPKTKKRLWKRINQEVAGYFAGVTTPEELTAIFASYQGLLKPSWNSDDTKRLEMLERCL